MSKFMDRWFGEDPKQKTLPYRTIEIEKGLRVPNRDDDGAIASLAEHPGMVALLNRLKLKQAYLKSQLETGAHKTLRDVDCLQLGLYWSRHLELEISAAIGRLQTKRASKVASPELETEFEKARLAIEAVGTTSSEL